VSFWSLETLWFVLIAVLWVGYFFLEGFDFGVGMLLRRLSRDDVDRRALIHTIGPVWDGNEVWLLTAGGATFAAFPEWYASLFSGFYLPLVIVLVALIVRGVAFEFWGKHDAPRWRATWEGAIVVGSLVPSVLWGVAFANIVHGIPMDADGEVTASLLDLLGPYALLGGLTTLLLFLAHGASFLALRTADDLRERARSTSRAITPLAAASLVGFLAWTLAASDEVTAGMLAAGGAAAVAAVAAAVLSRTGREALTFASGGAAIVAAVAALFLDLWPNVLVSSTAGVGSLTVAEAASSHYTLTVMSVVALVLVPLVLLYQGWTYYVFRHRIGRGDVEPPRTPLDIFQRERTAGGR